MNHANLPTIATAPLPQTYQAAQSALASCANVDECQDWADKAQALASYARQAGDDTLRKMAERIQARAIRRGGEMFHQIEKANGVRTDLEPSGGAPTKLTRKAVAAEAGISKDQMVTMIRVANLDQGEFEAAVESDDPPTVTALAKAGTTPKQRNIIDLGGRDPAEFNRAMHFRGMFEDYARALSNKLSEVGDSFEFLTDSERARIRESIATIDGIHDRIVTRL